jgi:hypothetical protein
MQFLSAADLFIDPLFQIAARADADVAEPKAYLHPDQDDRADDNQDAHRGGQLRSSARPR